MDKGSPCMLPWPVRVWHIVTGTPLTFIVVKLEYLCSDFLPFLLAVWFPSFAIRHIDFKSNGMQGILIIAKIFMAGESPCCYNGISQYATTRQKQNASSSLASVVKYTLQIIQNK